MASLKYLKNSRLVRGSDPFSIQSGKFKDGILQPVYRSPWSEDVFISDNNEKETVGNSFNSTKLTFFSVMLFLALCVLLSRAAWLQIVKGDYYSSMAEGNRIRIERIAPMRGVIYDRNKNALVRNKANFMLYVVPADLPKKKEQFDDLVKEIKNILGDEVASRIETGIKTVDMASLDAYQPLFIDDNIDYEKAMLLDLKSRYWPGVELSNRSNRDYLYTGVDLKFQNEDDAEVKKLFSLSHLMGYTGKINNDELIKFGDEYLPIDYIGKMGIEYFWENELKGVSGKKQIEVDALGNEKKIIGEKLAVDGHNLVLSLDVNFQLKLEEILQKHLDKLKLKRASAVVMDPNNGEIVAMVSLPAYNNNMFSRGITPGEYSVLINNPDKPLVNHVISGQYPSGSVIKPVMAVAALEEGVITEDTYFISDGGIRIGQWFFPDWRAGGHGRTDVKKAIADSVNTFFYYIGGGFEQFQGLGVERIVNYFAMFGLGSQLGIDLAGETSGLIPSPVWKEKTKNEPWYVGDTYHMSIGQGDVLVTPLQVASFTSVFANGGKLFRPHLIKYVLDSKDNLMSEVDASPVRENFLDDYNLKIVRDGMRQTVTNGSARSMQSAPVTIAGKTGTAQWSSEKQNHAWFSGFAPFDKPELVITILIEEGGEGSSVAVPIANEALSWYFGEYKKTNQK